MNPDQVAESTILPEDDDRHRHATNNL